MPNNTVKRFNTRKLENIFRIMRPADEIAAEKISNSMNINNNYVKRIIELFINTDGGIKRQGRLIQEIKDIVGDDPNLIKVFDSFVDVYTSGNRIFPGERHSKAPYMYLGGGEKTVSSLYGEICPKPEVEDKEKTLTIVVSKTPFISLMRRDVGATEIFLNFLPSIVISRCVPYFDVEFVFNRPPDQNTKSDFLNGPSLIRFLNGDIPLGNLGRSDNQIVSSKRKQFDADKGTGQNMRLVESAGMELFTSPQTLVNMNGGPRVIPVLDRTRPLLSIESAQIVVDPMAGLHSNKRLTLNLKLHDKSRLIEIADIMQLSGANRVSVWVTYGWRHPQDMSTPSRSGEIEMYGQFINEKMLVKECYQFINATYSFDTTGQVSIVCELYAQGVADVKNIALHESEGFEKIRKLEQNLSSEIKKFQIRNNLMNLSDKIGSKEVRPIMIFNSAMNGSFPNLEKGEVTKAIAQLVKILKQDGLGINPAEVAELEKNLKNYYSEAQKGQKSSDTLAEQRKKRAEEVITEKFKFLSGTPDPFIPFVEKNTKRSETQDDYQAPEYMSSIEALIKAGGKKIVSFGKLFCSIMSPALSSSEDFDEAQIFFYTLNGMCGKASNTNVAEFPIELETFKAKYTEYVSKYGTAVITVEQFISLATASEFRRLTAPAYGFNANLFKKEKDGTVKPTEDFNDAALAANNGRGAFQTPDIRIFSEMIHTEQDGIKSFDRLALLEQVSALKRGTASSSRVLRIHIYDVTCNIQEPNGIKILSKNISGAFSETSASGIDRKKAEKIVEEGNIQNTGNEYTSFQRTGGKVIKKDIKINNREDLRLAIADYFPVLIPGMNSSAILEAKISSRADPNQKAAVMTGMNSGKELQSGPRGEDVGDLPVQVIPSELELRTIGCPLLSFAQRYFVDLNTGTTIDNVYGINNVTHSFNPGKFESTIKMVAYDAYARIGSPQNMLKSLIRQVDEVKKKTEEEKASR